MVRRLDWIDRSGDVALRRTLRWLALAVGFVVQGCAGDPLTGGSCAVDGERGCICRMEPRLDDEPFPGVCDEDAFPGERTICCRGASYCFCEHVRCGIAADGVCLCGIGPSLERTVGSCDGTASTCCTQDTGYCYCEEGCAMRFSNRLVTSCSPATETASCGSFETRVASCE